MGDGEGAMPRVGGEQVEKVGGAVGDVRRATPPDGGLEQRRSVDLIQGRRNVVRRRSELDPAVWRGPRSHSSAARRRRTSSVPPATCSVVTVARIPPGRSRVAAFAVRRAGRNQCQEVNPATASNGSSGGGHSSKVETITSTPVKPPFGASPPTRDRALPQRPAHPGPPGRTWPARCPAQSPAPEPRAAPPPRGDRRRARPGSPAGRAGRAQGLRRRSRAGQEESPIPGSHVDWRVAVIDHARRPVTPSLGPQPGSCMIAVATPAAATSHRPRRCRRPTRR